MRTIDFSQILFNSIQLSGNDRHNIRPETFAQFRDFSSTRLREAWETFEWPDVCRTESFTSTVIPGDNGDIKYFTPIAEADEILAVFDKNPLASTRVTQHMYTIYNDSSKKIVTGLQSGWYVYRIKCPELVGDIYDQTIQYSPGSQIYWDEGSESSTYEPVPGKPHKGNFYECLYPALASENPATHPVKWKKINIPYVFGSYMAWGSAANWQVSEGMVQEAAAIEIKAKESLENEYDKATRQQGQFNRLNTIKLY